jgi:hypothetical protein
VSFVLLSGVCYTCKCRIDLKYEPRLSLIQLEEVNMEHVYGGTMPTQERTCGSSSYDKRFTKQIVHLKMASYDEKCSVFKYS